MRRLLYRIVGDAVIIGAWLAFVVAFLVYLAPGWAWWAQGIVVVVTAIAGCSIGGAWAARWKGPAPAGPASQAM